MRPPARCGGHRRQGSWALQVLWSVTTDLGDLTPDLGHAKSRLSLKEARRSDGGEEDVLRGVPPGCGGAVPDDAGGDGGGHRRGPGDHGLDVVDVVEGRRGGGVPAPCWPVRAANTGR